MSESKPTAWGESQDRNRNLLGQIEKHQDRIAELEAENAKLRDALRYIAESMRWGEDTAIKRTITDLQNTAQAALEEI